MSIEYNQAHPFEDVEVGCFFVMYVKYSHRGGKYLRAKPWALCVRKQYWFSVVSYHGTLALAERKAAKLNSPNMWGQKQ